MAEAPRRRKFEKDPVQPNTQKSYCYRCGTSYSRRKGFFPVSHSPMYRGAGYLPICNECVEAMYEQYRAAFGDDREAMRRMCMKMDLYWSDSIYDMVERTAGVHSRVRNYIGKTNLQRYIDKTYDDTIDEESLLAQQAPVNITADALTVDDIPLDAEAEDPIPQDLIDFWGRGYTLDFYNELDERYKEWTSGKDVVNPSERSLYRTVCLLETIIRRDGAQGKPIEKNVAALNNLLGSMNLKPAQQKTEADAELDKMPLGVGIQKWEFSRPLPDIPKENCDQSGLIKNITTWFLGHACKMVGLKNSYCKMYEVAMEQYKVERPEYADEEDDTILSDIFANPKTGGDEP